ncbi:unnamed protein product, partial [marine sediment metagenome]
MTISEKRVGLSKKGVNMFSMSINILIGIVVLFILSECLCLRIRTGNAVLELRQIKEILKVGLN